LGRLTLVASCDRAVHFDPASQTRPAAFAGSRRPQIIAAHLLRCHRPAADGVAPGISYGQSDEFGYQAVEGRAYRYDLHATVLHLLRIDHKRLTFRTGGIDRRLTDVHGRVIHEILA